MSVMVLFEAQVKPECVDDLKASLKALLPDTRAFKGCQGVDIYDNVEDNGNLVFYERWDSREDYEKYIAWRTETGVMAQLGETLAGPPSVRYFERVDA